MSSESRWKKVTFLIAAFFVKSTCGTDTDTDATALSVTPSTTWIGNDGDWSPIAMRVGAPTQWLYLLVSTASSETWVIGTGGCDTSTLCSNDRGGLFNESYSETWVPEGFYNLGLDTQLGFGGYGDYGLDVLTFGTTGISLTDAIIASVNATEYWVGFFGLGIVPGNFTDITARSAISGLVETEGVIPSHSYGYTAGASYQLKGMPVSLTLGGYDENRLEFHNTTFELNPSQQPEVYIDSISVISSNSSNDWTTEVSLLSTTDRVYATIDSSTPYLWLPASVCERFASSLGLTYNTSLELYTFDSDPSQHDVLGSAELTFTFNLSDTSTSDDIVTITLPYAAFDLELSYPFIPNTTYGSTDATKYYFPLRQASGANQYTIGRAFLQEAYIIIDYERNNFSVHQAVHTEDPIANTSLVDIPRYYNTTFSGLPVDNSPAGLRTGAIVGIVVGCIVGVTFIALLVFCLRFRRQGKDATDNEKDPSSSTPGSRSHAPGASPSSSPRTFLDRLLQRQKDPVIVHEAAGNSSYPTEMATESHERYELPASLPAELHSESNTLAGTAENSSTRDTPNLSAYEIARRKLERQQAEAERGFGPYLPEKTQSEFSHLVHYHAPESLSDSPSPLSSPLPSPLPSHVGHGSYGQSSSDSGGSAPSPISPAFRPLSTATGPPTSPPPEYRRTPNNTLYAGPIPADVQLPEHVPRVVDSADRTTLETGTHPASSTLGSHYTEYEMDSIGNIYDEDSIEVSHDTAREHESRRPNARGPNWPLDEEEGTRIIGGRVVRDEDESKFRMEDVEALRSEIQMREAEDPNRNRRRLDGEDLVHVPIPAPNRFSFESNKSGEGRGTMI